MNLHELLHELDEAVFPSGIYCICCGSMIDRTRTYSLCDDCIGRFHWITGRTCAVCGKAMPDTSKGRLCYDCMKEPHEFVKGYSALTYGLHERELMMDLKYGGKGYLAKIFGDILFDRMEPEILDGFTVDLIVPVPVSAGRLRKRGYNQTELMGRQLAARWRDYVRREHGDRVDGPMGAPAFRPNLLRRTRETRMLRSLNPTERRMTLQGVFAVREADLPLLEGRSVLLIDDIYTTGATADACSGSLLRAGAAEVYLLTLASGGNRKPETDQ